MKKSKLVIFLIIITFILLSYIIYDKLISNKVTKDKESSIKIINKIELEYCNIYLLNNGISYIEVLDSNSINKLNAGNNLKERLNTLYNRSFDYELINNKKIKGFKVELNSSIKEIKEIKTEDNIYVVFLKDNNTIGLFNYNEYYDLLYTEIIDNYNDYKNIKEINNDLLIFSDGSSESIYLKG